MPQTTTAVNSCDVVIRLDDELGALQDISGSSNEVSITLAMEIGEFFTFGSRWKGRLCCRMDAPVTLKIEYSTAADEAWDLLKTWWGTEAQRCIPRTLQINIPDSAPGSDRFQGEFLLENLDVPVDASESGPIEPTASLLPTGEVTLTTVAT